MLGRDADYFVGELSEVCLAQSVFLVNRSMEESAEFIVDVARLGAVSIHRADSLFDTDIHATNTISDPERVTPTPNETARLVDGELRIILPPVSWTAVTLR